MVSLRYPEDYPVTTSLTRFPYALTICVVMLRRYDSPFGDETNGGPWEGYDTAQVCVNGHSINECAQTQPEHNQKFCSRCGAGTITTCPKCSCGIHGCYHSPGVIIGVHYTPPGFCHNCGSTYPWTQKKLDAARELANELEELDAEEKSLLARSLDDLVRENPNTPVAVNRFKKLVAKAGAASAQGFRNILVDVLSEAVRKQIWP